MVVVPLVKVKYISTLLIWQKASRSVGTSFKKSSVWTSLLEGSDFEYTPKMTRARWMSFGCFLAAAGTFGATEHSDLCTLS